MRPMITGFGKHPETAYILLLFLFFLVAYILPLGSVGLIFPDETRYGEIPREMIAGGDWVVPHLNGVRYFEKPPMGYWVNAASILLFGETNFAVRLPSALAVGLSALMIFVLIQRILSGHEEESTHPSPLGALIFLSSFEVFGVGNLAVLDSMFSFFLTATIAFFYMATEEQAGSWREKAFLLLAGLWCGYSFLTKGFLAFVIPALVLVPYLMWERRFRDLFRMGWLPLIAAVLVTLPWGISIHLREPDFWRFFFWNEHIRRFLADNAQHKESFWFFFMVAPGMFMPWTFLLPAAISGIRRRLNDPGHEGRLLRLSFCWLLLPFLFFSVSNGKLLTYILPCFPPFAVLMAFGLSHALERNVRNRFFRRAIIGNAVFLGIILVTLLSVQLFGYEGFHPYRHPWKMVMAVNGLMFFILFSLGAIESSKRMRKMIFIGFSPLLLFFFAHFTIPELISEAKIPGLLLDKHNQYAYYNHIIISDESSVQAVCWYLRRNNVYVVGNPGELNYGFKYDDSEDRLLNRTSLVDLVNRNRGRTIFITRSSNISEWDDWFPTPIYQKKSGPAGYLLAKY